jgi:RNA polymerase sigma-70 factor (ECF subfamily)
MSRRTNEQWLSDLRSAGQQRENALAELQVIVLKGLPYALSQWLSPDDPRFEPLAEEATQETLLRVLDNLDTFQGRSQFTTWVHKIAIRVALTELRRKRWENVSLDELVERDPGPASRRLMADAAPSPENIAEGADMLDLVRRIINEELTDRQRQAMMAIVIHGVPLEEVARRMGTNRNALYKLMHDTRLRLKQRLAREGLSPEEVLAIFEER